MITGRFEIYPRPPREPEPAAPPPSAPAPAPSMQLAPSGGPAVPVSFGSLLVANRGEIARRVIRTAREMGLRTVAVYSEADRQAPFVREADAAVALGGVAASESYLQIDKIVAAATRSGAAAVHPGYGFLSENADFADACAAAGLVFVGPTPANIRAMGGKIGAKRLASAAGVPTLPSATIDGDDEEAWARAAGEVGYPVLVKASAGGGGRGMRTVTGAGELAEAIRSARREAASSFGDGTVFLERFLPSPRHIEVQVFADHHGNCLSLWERECSVQRRHQKIIEEAPSPAVDHDLRRRMGEAAVALARAIEYVGAGTVEFLVEAGEFFFLEMNTRLQVEHPVTEEITGLDLVRWQLMVAMGERLPLTQGDVALQGHAIEVRLYAEDPADGFAPSYGRLHTYERGATPGVRFDDGVESGQEISTAYDPMLAKVIAHAPTRREAAARLQRALAEMRIHGPTTNREYLVGVLGDGDFLAGLTTTAYVADHASLLTAGPPVAVRRVHTAAAVLHGAAQRRAVDRLWGFAPAGWRNVPSQGQRACVRVDGWVGDEHPASHIAGSDAGAAGDAPPGSHTVEYGTGPGDAFRMRIDQFELAGRVLGVRADAIDLEIDGMAHTCRIHRVGPVTWVNTATGQSTITEIDRFPDRSLEVRASGPTAPVPGRVVLVNVAVGDTVTPGQVLVVMEAMKMEHKIEAAVAAVVREVLCAVGDQVDAHQVLVALDDL